MLSRGSASLSSPVEALVLGEVWSWVGGGHAQFDGLSQVGVTEDLLIPGGVVGPGHGRGVQLLRGPFCTRGDTSTHV